MFKSIIIINLKQLCHIMVLSKHEFYTLKDIIQKKCNTFLFVYALTNICVEIFLTDLIMDLSGYYFIFILEQ